MLRKIHFYIWYPQSFYYSISEIDILIYTHQLRLEFLNLSTRYIFGQIILCCRSWPASYRMFSNIHGLNPLSTSITSLKLWQPKMSPNALQDSISPENYWLRYWMQGIPQFSFYIFKGRSFDLLNLTCSVWSFSVIKPFSVTKNRNCSMPGANYSSAVETTYLHWLTMLFELLGVTYIVSHLVLLFHLWSKWGRKPNLWGNSYPGSR